MKSAHLFGFRWWLTLCTVFAVLIAGCANPGTGGVATTQPGWDTGSLVSLALIDYEALVASGVVKETPELDAAITAIFAAKKAYEEGQGTLGAVNAAGLQLAIALSKARNK